MKSQIGYVHLHDNHGVTDEHLGLGEGNVPLQETLGALEKYSPEAVWALETDPKRFVSSLDWLADHQFI
jgi:sugar phosphate isomerase/epimerase